MLASFTSAIKRNAFTLKHSGSLLPTPAVVVNPTPTSVLVLSQVSDTGVLRLEWQLVRRKEEIGTSQEGLKSPVAKKQSSRYSDASKTTPCLYPGESGQEPEVRGQRQRLKFGVRPS